MQKLVWINSKGTEINLTSGDYGITEWVGFSACDVEIQTQNVPFQDGSVFLDALLNNRELSVTLAINDGKDLEKRYRLRRELIAALNPKLGEGYLIYTNDFISKRIKCLAQMPVFPTHNSDKAGTPKASLSWTACDPYWEDVEETKFSYIAPKQVTINNEGDVPTQLKIELFSAITNPSIKNLTTKQQLSFLFDEPKDVEINTNIGNKNIFEIEDNDRRYFSEFDITRCFYSNKLQKYVIILSTNYVYLTLDFINIEPYGISNGYLDKVIEVNNNFYSCGADKIYYGDDLLNLNLIQFEDINIKKVCYSDELNLFCIVGGTNKIYVSTDFINWTDVSVTLTDPYYMSDVIYCKYLHKFIAVNRGRYLLFSDDGYLWTYSYYTEVGVEIQEYLYEANNKNVLFLYSNGYCRYSTNATDWSNTIRLTTDNKALCFFEKNDLIYCATQNSEGQNVLKFSNAGKEWFVQYTNFEGEQINQVIIKDFDTFFLGNHITLVKSMDYEIWERTGNLESLANRIFDIVYNENLNLFVYGTQYKVYIFKENLENKQVVLEIPNVIISISIINNYTYVITRNSNSQHIIIYKTEDYYNWETITTDITTYVSGKIQYIKKYSRFYFQNSEQLFLYSNDLIHWNSITLGGYRVNLYNEKLNIFVSTQYIGNINTYAVSSNGGTSWTNISTSNIKGRGIVDFRNRFIILNGNTINISEDSYTWETVNLSDSYDYICFNKFNNKYYLLNYSAVYFAETFDFMNIQKQKCLPNLSSGAFSNKLNFLFGGYNLMILMYKLTKNCISDLDKTSDMNFQLDIGKNIINLTPNQFTCNFSYRQKYIGV